MILAEIVIGTKKEGESCGEGFSFMGMEDCGHCAEGLECAPDTSPFPSCTTCEKVKGDIFVKEKFQTTFLCDFDNLKVDTWWIICLYL